MSIGLPLWPVFDQCGWWSLEVLGLNGLLSSASARNHADMAAVFIDIAKAFDRVWIDGLIYKMHKLEIPIQLTLLIQSYLKNRKFTVRVEKEQSTFRTTEAGVVEGSRLGPHCFNIFINDICQMPNTQLALFADDTAIMCTGPDRTSNVTNLNKHLAELEH
ncbi:hypothetical protein AVEN_265780-1 [Araneus ventricosus]|uniref:Reverse transcriptase domain-containing protein n=1 Tax=Araneus ventricosus TaxID=182803 RepID=A0A4Y2L8Z9_ARAVE|nr:hypothetical protein AVEN_265780-1 [Araneus ventricosus]